MKTRTSNDVPLPPGSAVILTAGKADCTIRRNISAVWFSSLLCVALLPNAIGQNSSPAQDQGKTPSAPPSDASALEFLGSYSAPSAIMATETGHTSARPPSPAVEQRLRQIEGGLPTLRWLSTVQGTGDAAEVRRALSRLLATSPDDAALWFELGTVALEESRANSRRLWEVAPESPWNRRLEAAALGGRYPALAPEVRSHETEARSQEKAAIPNPVAQGTTAPERGGGLSAPGAVDADLQKLEGLPESPEVLYQRARAALELSEGAYLRASRSPGFEARLCALRALAAEEEHDEVAAIQEYQAGLARHPDSAILHAGLGHLYRQRQDYEAAGRELAEARRLNPADPIAAFELGDTLRHLGQALRALGILNQALELDPELLLARWSRGKAYLALGDDERALADLEAARPVDSTGELEWQLAGLYRKLGQPEQANQAQQRSEAQRAGKKAASERP